MNSTNTLARLLGGLSLSGAGPRATTTVLPAGLRTFTSTGAALARVPPKKAGGAKGIKGGAKGKTQTKAKPKKKNKSKTQSENAKHIKTLKQNMFSPAPPPLRMARHRHLRHWTIHRAWQLFRRQQHEATHRERSRMQAGMYNACEALREVSGPGDRSEGYLYRVAMEKKGVWNGDAIPIEYARMQTESPAERAWNHDWKR